MSYTPDIVARVRQDYVEDIKTVQQICDEYEITSYKLYAWVAGTGEAQGLAPLPRRRGAAMRPGVPRRGRGRRVALVKRIWRTAEAQVRDIETRLTRDAQVPEERERDARVLAIMVKTLRELTVLDERERADKPDNVQADDGPRDDDEFRRELARRMDAFVDQRTGAGVSGAAGDE
jgi:transposase-like protein